MKIKYNCWTGIEMLEVHTLDLDGDCVEGYHHFAEGEPLHLSENKGHVFLQHCLFEIEGKEINWIEGDVIAFNQDDSLFVIVWDKKLGRFGIQYISHEPGTILWLENWHFEVTFKLGNIFEMKGLKNKKNILKHYGWI